MSLSAQCDQWTAVDMSIYTVWSMDGGRHASICTERSMDDVGMSLSTQYGRWMAVGTPLSAQNGRWTT